MAKRLVPLFDRVLVEKVATAAKSAGGVLLPETVAVGGFCGPNRELNIMSPDIVLEIYCIEQVGFPYHFSFRPNSTVLLDSINL